MKKQNYPKVEKYVFKKLKKLPKNLYYHGPHHTKDVLKAVKRLAKLEKIFGKKLLLLKTATLFHDIGFLEQYKNNESIGVKIAKESLPKFGYTKKEIKIISKIIMATKMPQKPKTKLEKIMCDADLDNFGRKDFFIQTELVKRELVKKGVKISQKKWYEQTVKLLENHKYFTKASKKLRNKRKEKNIHKIKNILGIN